jgi:hypothetical protein
MGGRQMGVGLALMAHLRTWKVWRVVELRKLTRGKLIKPECREREQASELGDEDVNRLAADTG